MKKIVSIILAVIMVMSMTACTNNKSSVSLEEVKQMAEEIEKYCDYDIID